ncbi:MAG: VPLPA-CTERM sorting domain-containing protein [Proteobacteria bacterium]|nr:VPLPA-CTERM sorting domain-containing protein [Pseudomonadota bacterium]
MKLIAPHSTIFTRVFIPKDIEKCISWYMAFPKLKGYTTSKIDKCIQQMIYDIISNPNGTDSPPVPLPAAVLLLGTGLIGLVGVRRKFRD